MERKLVGEVTGVTPEEDVDALQAFAALKEKFKGNVFLIHREHPSADAMVVNKWKKALGANRVLPLNNPKAGVDCMLGVMALVGDSRSLGEYLQDMEDRGQDEQRVSEIAAALAVLSLPADHGLEEKKDDRPVVGSVSVCSLGEAPVDVEVVEGMSVLEFQQAIELQLGLTVSKQYLPTLPADVTQPMPSPLPSSVALRVQMACLPVEDTKLLRFDLQWGYPDAGKDFLDGTCFVYQAQRTDPVDIVDFKQNNFKKGAIIHRSRYIYLCSYLTLSILYILL